MASTQLTAREEWRRGWPTVLASAFGMSAAVLYLYSAGTLIAPIQADTGWSRAQIGSGITVITVSSILANPLVGALVDRFGARRLALTAIILYPPTFAAIALTTDSIWSWWFHWALLGVLGFSMTPATWTASIANLFDRSRGLALAVTMSGMGLGSISIPIISTYLIEQHGWRGAFVGLGAIWSAIGVPLVYFALRDGHKQRPRTSESPGVKSTAPLVWTLLFSRSYLTLICAVFFFTFVAMSFVISIVPILIWQGLDASRAAGLASMLGLSAVVGRLSTGYLLDRLDTRMVTAVAMSLPIFAAALLWLVPGSSVAAGTAILIMGLSLGAEVDAIAYLVSRYFDMRNYALLFATTVSIASVATGLAPLVSGMTYDATGGYNLLLLIIIFPCIISAAAIMTLARNPAVAPIGQD